MRIVEEVEFGACKLGYWDLDSFGAKGGFVGKNRVTTAPVEVASEKDSAEFVVDGRLVGWWSGHFCQRSTQLLRDNDASSSRRLSDMVEVCYWFILWDGTKFLY